MGNAVIADEAMDTDFLEWLGKTVGEALTTAEQHESLKSQVRELRTAVENRFDLIAVHVRVYRSKRPCFARG